MAQFAEITLEEMDRFIRRAWRALRPKQSVVHNINVYDLFLSKNVMIRIWTTIPAARETVRDVGETTIKVTLLNAHNGRPLAGKATAVKRVMGWKDNLQDRIEDVIELYDDQEYSIEQRAGGNPPPPPVKPTEMSNGREDEDDRATDLDDRDPGNEAERQMAVREMEREEREDRERQEQERARQHMHGPLTATFTKLRNGDWGLRILGEAKPGDEVVAKRQSGQAQNLTVGEIVWKGRDNRTNEFVTVAGIGRSRMAAEEGQEEGPDEGAAQDEGEPYEDYSRTV